MATTIKTVKCPLCGWHHPAEQKGSMRLQRGDPADLPKGVFLFDKVNPEESAFISIRECRGRGGGLPEVGRITLTEAKGDAEYQELIQSVINQCYKILKVLTS